MTNALLKTDEKLFNFHVVHGIHPLKWTIPKNQSGFYSEIENNVLQ